MKQAFKRKVDNICQKCGKVFFTRPSETRKYCCVNCFKMSDSFPNGKRKGFGFWTFWDNATHEEKIVRYRELYEKRVIKKEGCWDWNRNSKEKRYGSIGRGKYRMSNHRISWILHKGPIPDKLWVLHRCHNPICSNPDHLYVGTAKENTRDMLQANRGNRSRQNSKLAKLTREKAKEIKELLQSKNLSQQKIANRFNVTQGVIKDIARNKTWKDA